MTNPRLKRQTRKQIPRLGRTVALHLREEIADTSRGTGYQQAEAINVDAVIDYGGQTLAYDLFGVDSDAELVAWARDDVDSDTAAPIRDTQEAGDDGATRVFMDGDEFRVIESNTYEQYGAYMLECTQIG